MLKNKNRALQGCCTIFVAFAFVFASFAQSPPLPSAKLASAFRNSGDILALMAQIKPDPERVAAYRAAFDKPLPQADAFWTVRRDALLARMDAAESLGDLRARTSAADELALLFKARDDRPRLMEFALSYSAMLIDAGRAPEGLALREEMAKDPRTTNSWLIALNYQRAVDATREGNAEKAQVYFDAAAQIYNSHGSYTGNYLFSQFHHRAQASLLRLQGRYPQAQASYVLALRDTQKWMDDMAKGMRDIGKQAIPANRGNAIYVTVRLEYARMLLDLGKLREAEEVTRAPLLWALDYVGKYSPHTSRAVSAYANVLIAQGRFAEAEKMAQVARQIMATLGAPDQSSFVLEANQALGRALLGQEKWREADLALQAAVDSRLAEAQAMGEVSGVAAVMAGRAHLAAPGLLQLVNRSSANIGADHPVTAQARGVYAMALAASTEASQRGEAIAQFKRALPGLLASRKQLGEAEEALRVKIRQWILEAYLDLLAELAPTQTQALEDSFVVAEMLRSSTTQQAVVATAARAATTDPLLAAVVRREQDLRNALVNSYRNLQRLSGLSLQQLQEAKEDPALVRAQIDSIAKEHSALFTDIEKRFPKYANLIDPKPPSIADLRAVLRPGEVLVNVLSGNRRSLVWAVSASGPTLFHATDFSEAKIAPLVKQLRSAVDVGNLSPLSWPNIDIAASHQLYRALFAPIEKAFESAHTLIVVANQSMGSLPPAMLVTQPYALGADKALPFDRYASVPWLGKQWATAQSPSTNALVSLRSVAPSAAPRQAFLGFGDPVFSTQAAVGNATTRAILRNSAQALRPTDAAASAEQVWIPYSKLAPLPDTRDELLAMAKALGADAQRDVIVGAQATKQRIMQTELSKSRILAFATHGLLPGDFPGLSQPALALSVPVGKNADLEPLSALLTLEDVLSLKLDADWVVLSACNTASADGQGSEAVSGLGRGFFYAGTRALLVTHWSVDSESAKDLVSQTFTGYAQDPKLSRAIALNRAMAFVRDSIAKDDSGKPSHSLAHPLFWAPYALFGEPSR